MKLLRRHQSRLAACAAAMYLLLWLGLLLSPCLMAMSAATTITDHVGMRHTGGSPPASAQLQHALTPAPQQHACEHCPPVLCDLVTADVLISDCDSVNVVLQAISPLDDVDQMLTADFEFASDQQQAFKSADYPDRPPLRAGPRRHLLFQQFNE